MENKPKCEAEKGSKKKKAKSKQKERKSASGKKESAKRADSWSSKWPSFAEHWEGVSGLLEGQWRGPKGETYQMSFEEPSDDDVTGCCTRDSGRDRDRMSQRTFSICYEYDTCLLWWGLQRKFCLDPEEVRSNPHCARWYVVGKDTPEFEASDEIETVHSFSMFFISRIDSYSCFHRTEYSACFNMLQSRNGSALKTLNLPKGDRMQAGMAPESQTDVGSAGIKNLQVGNDMEKRFQS